MTLKLFRNIITILFLLYSATSISMAESGIHIRLNQLGFLPGDLKSGIIISEVTLDSEEFKIVCYTNKDVEFRSKLKKSKGAFGKFKYSYTFDFSKFKKEGEYIVEVKDQQSHPFKIDAEVYNQVVDSLMQFFKVQRCGYTNPMLHETCHKGDVAFLLEGEKRINQHPDLTGGWHDAADYVKFLNTTAFTTYTLLFAYDFDQKKFGFDNNDNGTPDILEEARVGLDWMLRANYEKYKLVTQVQDLSDHEQGFRLPENDKLEFARPGFIGIGKNLIGIYTAAMSLASRIWRSKFYDNEFADKCLTAAENLFSIRNDVADIDSSGSGMYIDAGYKGKLALGAVEMYLTTNRSELLNEAVELADAAGSEYWWSWGNIAAYAHYRLGKLNKRFADYLENNLIVFNTNKDSSLFNEATSLTWGSNNTLLGVALQNILWKKLKYKSDYDTVATFQRDYIMGRNQWGVCFIQNIGTVFSENLHHQISYLKNGRLPGGFAAGPVLKEFLDQYNIPFEKEDRFKKFQTREAVYRDDPMDYITNEPTIVANATAIFVMGYYSKR